MIAYVTATPSAPAAGFGRDTLDQFGALSRLHADGWGSAWADATDGRIRATGSAVTDHGDAWTDVLAEPSRTRMLYLRFASRGAPPMPENVQPFLRDGVSFQHNGLIAPRERALDLLTDRERGGLRGTTDSEVYLALVLRALRETGAEGTSASDRIAGAVRALRTQFPDACLNAMLLTPEGLHVVHSPGTAAPPLAAFAERGVGPDDLPPGHDRSYNTLWIAPTDTGHRIATSGIDVRGWQALPAESVTVVSARGVWHTAIPD